ncbi:hypothetical protein FNYG_12149 [Fusarium nygamai]|uniref:Uncharacterized protein n=1 Tax=Gibberella nygamai TaxID=42673 RepID=A0A2K0VWX2_GIBNY|nr:hypothetical protein FNYG_12149 [Fusarium nygamai]
MRSVHNSKLNDNQLRILANRNSRKMPKLFPSCPLCGKDEDAISGHLEDHLVGHLRSLALKSLPSYEDETPEDTENDNDSVDISRPQSRSTVREMRQAKGALPITTLRSSAFWDLWNPDVPQHSDLNFLGDPHTELENAVSFSAYSFKSNISNLYSDPVIQSILSKRRVYAHSQDMMTHGVEEGDVQVSGSGVVLGSDNTSTGNNHKPKMLQEGKQVRQKPMFDDGEDFPQQRVVSSEGNGYLILTIKDLQYLKPRWGSLSSRDGLICEASYGDEVSLLRFKGKGQDRDNTMILEVPSNHPKSVKFSILSEPMTNMQMLPDEILATTEVDVPGILSTYYTYRGVHKLFEEGSEVIEGYQTTEVSFDISWQLKDPRTAQKTRGAGHSGLEKLSEITRLSTVTHHDLLVSPRYTWETFEANYGELPPKLIPYYSMARDKLPSDLYSESQGSAQDSDAFSIEEMPEMPEIPKLPYNSASIGEDNFFISRKIIKQEKEDVIIEREVFDLQRFTFQELYAQKEWVEQSLEMGSLKRRFWLRTLDHAKMIYERSKWNQSLSSTTFSEEESNTAEVRKAVELSLKQIQEAIQVLDDYREVSEDESNAGRRSTITLDTTAVNNPTPEPPLLGLGESCEPSQRRRHSPSQEAKDEEALKERLRDRMSPRRIATVGKKSGRKSPLSPTPTNTGPPRWLEDYQKLSPRDAYPAPTPYVDSSLPTASPSPPPASRQRREKPESDPLPRRKKGDTKRHKKEWDSD